MTPVKQWIAALRSGKYSQTTQKLGDEVSGFCCLGVACDLAVKAGVIDDYDPGQGNLPVAVQQWLGLTDTDGPYGYEDGLTLDNDIHGMDFTEIADIIESEPEGLFA